MSLAHKKLSPQEYLAIERTAPGKSEYVNGEMFAMAGASERHELIKLNVASGLHAQFRNRPCRAYTSDMRVKVSPTGLYTYPDVVALCGEGRFEDNERDTLLNPALIVEILSPSTEAYDRGAKFAHYRKIESMSDYLLVAQDRVSVDHFIRQADSTWKLVALAAAEDVLEVPSVGVRISLADIYDKVEFPSASNQP